MSRMPSPVPPVQAPPRYRLVVVAASAGGVTALMELLGSLPGDFPLPIAVVQHRSMKPPRILEQVLGRRTALRVKEADEGERPRPGTVYLAPPDEHLVVQGDGLLHRTDGRRIRHLRSSANPLFESAAQVLHGEVIAVVLTGSGADGTDGVQSVKRGGGTVLAQEPASAAFPGMPRSALATGAVDEVLPLERIAPRLVELARERR
jgi:two-component system, chemotaxis family, protein-glutamate methylesterase/glutaminase